MTGPRGLSTARGKTARWFALLALSLPATVVIGCGSRPPIELAREAYSMKDWPRAEREARRGLDSGTARAEAATVLARSLARQGRGPEARALWLPRGGEAMEAEDLLLLGRGLVKEGRGGLGSAALAAAAKLDPKRRDAAEALAELSARGGSVEGESAVVDQLTAVPEPRALAELVVGLLRVDRPGEKASRPPFDPMLDRVRHLKRAELARVQTPDDARKLLVRFLLEDGRPADARDWLVLIRDRSDPEANWLASRVALLLGDVEGSSAAVEKAGHFGEDNPMAHEPSRYVGAKACAECHGTIYRAQQSSRHGATIASGAKLRGLPVPKSEVKDPADPSVVHVLKHEGDALTAEARVDGKTYKAVVDYAIGSGHHGLTYLVREKSGAHREMRLSYYTGGDYWGITDGFNPHPPEPDQFLGELMGADGFHSCLNCHSTRFHSEHDRKGPEAADKGIGCEKCHGPGENHLKAVETGFPQPAIARPRIATPAQRMALCARCHTADGSIPPTDPRFVRFQTSTLPYSRCVTESGGKLDCVACHDPHRNVETDPAYYEARCLACHGGKATGDRSIRVEAVAAGPCKLKRQAGCLSCHMPKVENTMKFTTFTDHHIRVHRERTSPNPTAPAAKQGGTRGGS